MLAIAAPLMIIFHVMNNSPDRQTVSGSIEEQITISTQVFGHILTQFYRATPKYISSFAGVGFFLQLCPFFSGEALLHSGIFIGRAPVKVAVKARAEGER